MEITRELLHRIPTQSSQGSEPRQVGGKFFQISFREFRAAAASKSRKQQSKYNMVNNKT